MKSNRQATLLSIVLALLAGFAIPQLVWPSPGIFGELRALHSTGQVIEWQGALKVEIEGSEVIVRDRQLAAAIAKSLYQVRPESRKLLTGRLGCGSYPTISAASDTGRYQIGVLCGETLLVSHSGQPGQVWIYETTAEIPSQELLEAWREWLVPN